MSAAQPVRKRSELGLPGLRCSLDEMRSASKADEDEVESAVEAAYARAEHLRRAQTKRDESGLLHEVFNASAMLADAANALVDDSFFRCFTSAPPDPWNWNLYLFPLWCAGFLVRHLVLFPARLLFLAFIMTLFFIAFIPVQACMKDTPTRRAIERRLVRFAAFGWVASWTGVIKYHGPKPVPAPNRVWVANHTSMIDYTILCQYVPFAAIMQLQPGWVGFLQTRVLQCLGCLWFNRTEVKDRKLVAERMKQHIQDPNSTPLLIFPEGTCVNNEYTVMFKQGAFSLGVTVCPVAIKYNKIFVDAFWNSRRQPFTTHIFKLMTSWAVVADIYFLPPQTLQEGEDPTQFATRVQQMIAEVAKLRIVPWDGYLKYYNLAEKRPQLVEARRSTIAEALLKKYQPAEEPSNDKKQAN